MEYIIQDKKLIWDFDEAESNATKLRDNNLFIEGIWNMKDTVGYTDTCVGVSMLSDDTFYFITFRGLGFTMRVAGDNVEFIKKQITK
ncbi:MAG: hypothetical protein IJZ55_02765 [Lachnospiraceae bacterium]|nr:hypothetical protein [Lachnospiraceae bacterium]